MTKLIITIVSLSVGLVLGVLIRTAQEKELITAAEAGCHAWCDKNNPEEIGNMLCKSQCTGIIVESQCLKFPNE